jgi:hypothetical protein
MTAKSAFDPQNPFDNSFGAAGAGPDSGFIPSAGSGSGALGMNGAGQPQILAATGEAASAGVTFTGTVETVEVSSLGIGVYNANGFNINLEFDAGAVNTAGFVSGIEQAALILAQTLTDKITVNIEIDASGTGGGAAAGPLTGYVESYSTIRSDLINNAAKGDPTFDALPASLSGSTTIDVWNAQLKALGILPANNAAADGIATFATDISSNALVGVALHELTHALGRVPDSSPDIFDLFRYTSTGNELFSGSIPAAAAYFSIDGGKTHLAAYGLNSDPSDFLNSGAAGNADPFDEYYTPGTTDQYLTTLDKEQLAALGFHLSSSVATTIQTDTNSVGSTSLVQLFSDYYLQNASTTGTGVELKYGGVPITTAELGSYTLIGAAPLSNGGYEVAFENSSTDMFSIWTTDSSGNFVSYELLSGTSPALQAIEASFNQDFIYPTGSTVIQTDTNSFGSTSLVEVGSDFYMYAAGTTTGPELQYNSSPFTASELSSYALIGAALLPGGGYEVAFKDASTDQFSIWDTNSSGNFISYSLYSGNSPVLESLEKSFNQDLNGDGTIGLPTGTTLIQTDTNTYGSTSLVQIGTDYYLENSSTGVGPELQYGGVPITSAALGSYTLIGAAPLSGGGYEVAFENSSTNMFSIWTTNSNGNFVSYELLSGTSPALQAIEASFNQNFLSPGSPAPTSPVSQLSVTVANSDTFLFAANGNTGSGANTAGASAALFDASSWASGNQFAGFFHDALKGASSFQSALGGADSFADPGHHDGAAQTLNHMADLHSGFLLH